MDFKHVMVDIETLDTKPTALVLSIGAVAFDPFTKELGETFYVEFTDDAKTQQELGRTVDADTVSWWMQQSEEARQTAMATPARDPRPLHRITTFEGLDKFAEYLARNGGRDIELWGNGADFDNVVIGSLYDSFSVKKPWSYSRNRCYRTIKRLFGDKVPLVRHGTHHNGLDDAITQAKHLQEIFKCIGTRP